MSSALIETKIYPVEEYLEREVASELRHEYRNGEIREMTGGTPTHNEIAGDLMTLLKIALRGKPYSIFITDQRLWIPARNLYTYPDVMVVERPIQLQAGRKDTVTNPTFIAEVLSDSTQAYDRGDKFAAYRTCESFQEYLLIDQLQYHVEQYTKQAENQWLFTEHHRQAARLTLASLGVEMTLAEIYENVQLEGYQA
jgi:Uma2 family endonuclease